MFMEESERQAGFDQRCHRLAERVHPGIAAHVFERRFAVGVVLKFVDRDRAGLEVRCEPARPVLEAWRRVVEDERTRMALGDVEEPPGRRKLATTRAQARTSGSQ